MADPRILIVTPEISYLPENLGKMAASMHAKAGGLADVTASLVNSLYQAGADVHLALPNYRRMFHIESCELADSDLRLYHSKLPDRRIHLAEDRIFYYRDRVYSPYPEDNLRSSLVFQREVINNIIPHVRPDIVHCNDWMTGLVPAMTRRMGIPSLFTLHNIHTVKILLEEIEETGIDTAEFWHYLYYESAPQNYEQTRSSIPVDLLTSGIFSAHWVNTVSPSFLEEIIAGDHGFIPDRIRNELDHKRCAGFASGITNAPDPSCDPLSDDALVCNYNAENVSYGKRENKREFQKRMQLKVNEDSPLIFWPSRLDPVQKGPELLTDILANLMECHHLQDLQIAFVADGAHAIHIEQIIAMENLESRVSIHPFDDKLSRLGFAASDFILMPSRFEPCGLTQMIAMKYGSLPVVHHTGGLKDTVEHLDVSASHGNGFVFNDYDCQAITWAIGCAMEFYQLESHMRETQIQRIINEANTRFTHEQTASEYMRLYEEMLGKPLHTADHPTLA